ncbi:hypothetical protein [Telmatospirillum sp. J64-1]|uniref:hypothetical protein n=1 Tax=Telmatospirillum sp. J64-1 TaxID=2502183 RepID=UPI00115D3B6A|nr:hypothetical protein [Telmatospirillum sp. J64-1]
MSILVACWAVLFAAIHIFIGRLAFLDAIPRSRWLSFAGGVAVSYVFVHLLPELAEHRTVLHERGFIGGELSAYLLALTGLSVFYGLERTVRMSRGRRRTHAAEEKEPVSFVFWLHIGSFALYNVLVGYLLVHREEVGFVSLLLYGVAMGLHFVTNDFGLRSDHHRAYNHTGRWILAASVLFGWLLGLWVTVPEAGISLLFAFLAGGVVMNVLKEELPEERQSRFLPFAFGAAIYALLMMF